MTVLPFQMRFFATFVASTDIVSCLCVARSSNCFRFFRFVFCSDEFLSTVAFLHRLLLFHPMSTPVLFLFLYISFTSILCCCSASFSFFDIASPHRLSPSFPSHIIPFPYRSFSQPSPLKIPSIPNLTIPVKLDSTPISTEHPLSLRPNPLVLAFVNQQLYARLRLVTASQSNKKTCEVFAKNMLRAPY